MATEVNTNGSAQTKPVDRLYNRLNEEKIVSSLDRLLDRLDAVEQAVANLTTLMQQGPGLVAMTMDMADEAVKSADKNGISIDERLATALQIAEKLTAPEMVEKLDGLLTMANQAPGLMAMTMDMVDDSIKSASANGINIDERLGAALQIAEKLTAPEMVEKLDGLLTMANQAPGLMAMTMDMVDDGVKSASANGINIDERLGAALQIAEKLTAPEMVEKLDSMLTMANQAPGLISMAMDTFDDEMKHFSALDIDPGVFLEIASILSSSIKEAEHMPKAKVSGIFSMLKTMRDPDRQKAIGFMMNVAKAYGKRLNTIIKN